MDKDIKEQKPEQKHELVWHRQFLTSIPAGLEGMDENLESYIVKQARANAPWDTTGLYWHPF